MVCTWYSCVYACGVNCSTLKTARMGLGHVSSHHFRQQQTVRALGRLSHLGHLILDPDRVFAAPAAAAPAAAAELWRVQMERGRGAVATVIIKAGSLSVGDPLVVGTEYGKVSWAAPAAFQLHQPVLCSFLHASSSCTLPLIWTPVHCKRLPTSHASHTTLSFCRCTV